MKLIFLTAILSSCAFSPKKLTPNFIDAKRLTCREYHVSQVKPKIVFTFFREYPISHCDGFLSLPAAQAMEIKRDYEESIHQDSGVALAEPMNAEELEAEILSGVTFNPEAPLTQLEVESDYDRGTESQEDPD